MFNHDMKRYHFAKCYYCICTACNSVTCPHLKYKPFTCCRFCISRGSARPRLDCSFFRHFRKSKSYRYRRSRPPYINLYSCKVNGIEYINLSMAQIENLQRSCDVSDIRFVKCVSKID